MLELKKGDKVIYLGNMPYKLSNGQEVFQEGEELNIQSNVNVQKKFFRMIESAKKPVEQESHEKEVNKKDDKKLDKKSKK